MPEKLKYKPPFQNPKMHADEYPFRNRNLKDLPGEIWKELPGFEGNVLLSDYGRIKSLSREVLTGGGHYAMKPEKILSPALEKVVMKNKRECYTIKINIGYNKKFHNLIIARWMYYLFVEPFDMSDKYIVVVSKDSDNTNLRPHNLMLSTRHAEIKRSFAMERRERNAFNTIPKKVIQLNDKGEVINRWPSVNQAAQHLEKDSKILWDILEGNLKNNRFNIWYDNKANNQSE